MVVFEQYKFTMTMNADIAEWKRIMESLCLVLQSVNPSDGISVEAVHDIAWLMRSMLPSDEQIEAIGKDIHKQRK